MPMAQALAVSPAASVEASSRTGETLSAQDADDGFRKVLDGCGEEDACGQEQDPAAQPDPALLPLAAFVAAAIEASTNDGEGDGVDADGEAMPTLAADEAPAGATRAPAIPAALLAEMVGASTPQEPAAKGPIGPAALAGPEASVQAAAGLQAPVAPPADAPAAARHQVHVPLHDPAWATQVGRHVAMLALRGAHSGSLSLVPENMGPIEVQIRLHKDTADVWFGASQADTRAALVEALPKLREMFASSGLALGDAQVSEQSSGRDGQPPAAPRGYASGPVDGVAVAAPGHLPGVGMLDLYA